MNLLIPTLGDKGDYIEVESLKVEESKSKRKYKMNVECSMLDVQSFRPFDVPFFIHSMSDVGSSMFSPFDA